jgi:4-diphosphocytidyl-2-C-methyl-D-erythritol kinase
MYNIVIVESPAKINLHLDVKGKRSDGYHEICSLFQMISLFDTITVRRAEGHSECTISGTEEIPTDRNLMYKAYRVFQEYSPDIGGVSIAIEKRIPIKAGLGGGSSNAASVLKALNSLFETGYSQESLAQIGAHLGSDVPFFCYESAVAIATGRGEQIRTLKSPKVLYGVLLYPFIEVDTAKAYSWLDERDNHNSSLLSESDIVDQYVHRHADRWEFCNSFQSVVENRFPYIRKLIEKLYALGAAYASVSGSGSALFGIFPREQDADYAKKQINATFSGVWKIKTLDRMLPVIVK